MQDKAEESKDTPIFLNSHNISSLTERIRKLPSGCALWLKMGSPACITSLQTSDGKETSDLVFVFDISTSPSKLRTIISAIPAGCIFTPDDNIPLAFLQAVCPVLSDGTFFRPSSLNPIINIELVKQILPRGCQFMPLLNISAHKRHSLFSNSESLAGAASASSLSDFAGFKKY